LIIVQLRFVISGHRLHWGQVLHYEIMKPGPSLNDFYGLIHTQIDPCLVVSTIEEPSGRDINQGCKKYRGAHPYMRGSGYLLHPVGEITTGCGRWERLAFLAIEFNRCFNDLAQLFKNCPFVAAMGPTIYQTRRAAHIAMIFLRPLNDFCILGAIFHFLDSSTANLTART
jgi:hypothetical protein